MASGTMFVCGAEMDTDTRRKVAIMSYKMAKEIRDKQKVAMYVIYSQFEPSDARYWSNEFGWVPENQATQFTYREMQTLDLPAGGYWVKSRGLTN